MPNSESPGALDPIERSATLDGSGAEEPRVAPAPRPMVVICPYCGHESANHARCERCKGLMDPLSRQASQNAMGPWFVRDEAAPFRPGCSYETLRTMVAKGRVTRMSIIRGPSTRQFWTRAASAPGVAHLLGQCHACHTNVSADFERCPSCGASFACVTERQSLGLGPVRLLPGHAAAEEIARSMVEAVRYSNVGAASEAIPRTVASEQEAPAPPAEVRRGGRGRLVLFVFVTVVILGLLAAWLSGFGTMFRLSK